MKPWGTPRPWPPNVDQELAQCLSQRSLRRRARGRNRYREQHPSLKVAMEELDLWLDDPRPYEPRLHKSSWRSMSRDVQAAICTRGPSLSSQTPSLDGLFPALGTAALGADTAARNRCRELNARGRADLATPQAAVAAFDDLVAAALSPVTTCTTIDDRLQVLDATLRIADRALEAESQALAGVLDNSAWDIKLALHDLDGARAPEGADIGQDAGLALDERLELCRRLLRQRRKPGRHVLWLGYGDAKLRAPRRRIEFGPVTFFNGPALLDEIDQVREGDDLGGYMPLPEELLANEALGDAQWRDWPKDEHWVAVRVDLGDGSYADPVRVASDQADALVKLAAFHAGGTSWQPFGSYHHVVDGLLRSSSLPFGPPRDLNFYRDKTDFHIEELAPHLAHHLPVQDSQLHELLDAAAAIRADSDDFDSTSLVHDVSIIELLSTRCGSASWQQHLSSCFAVRWAYDRVLDEIYAAVTDAMGDPDLRDTPGLPQYRELMRSAPGRGLDRFVVHYDIALAAISNVADRLPAYHSTARKIRTVAARIGTIQDLGVWIDALVDEYGCLVDRMARCRNSLTHGGPRHLDVAATVASFANGQAKKTTSIALWAVVAGRSPKVAHDEHRAHEDAWRKDARTAPTVLDALSLSEQDSIDEGRHTDFED